MKIRFPLIFAAAFAVGCFSISAQDNDSDEVFELSPFSIDSGGSVYGNFSFFNGSRPPVSTRAHGSSLNTVIDEFMRVYPSNSTYSPIRIVKPADALRIQYAISFYDDMEEIRESKLKQHMASIEAAFEPKSNFKIGGKRLVIKEGDRKKSLRKRRSEYTSHAYFTVDLEVDERTSLYDQIEEIESIVESLDLENDMTKISRGDANLVLDKVDQYRSELLDKIFADIDMQKAGLGTGFEVLVQGLGTQIQVGKHSEYEVEMWINYSQSIRSIREYEFGKAVQLLSLK